MFQELREIFLEHFQKHGESSLPFLVNGKISSQVFLADYKSLPPIEQMPEKEKKEMKLFVRELFPEKSVEELVVAATIIYVIGSLI